MPPLFSLPRLWKSKPWSQVTSPINLSNPYRSFLRTELMWKGHFWLPCWNIATSIGILLILKGRKAWAFWKYTSPRSSLLHKTEMRILMKEALSMTTNKPVQCFPIWTSCRSLKNTETQASHSLWRKHLRSLATCLLGGSQIQMSSW